MTFPVMTRTLYRAAAAVAARPTASSLKRRAAAAQAYLRSLPPSVQLALLRLTVTG